VNGRADDELVAIHSCDSRPEAEVLRSLLAAYDIPVYIRGGDLPGAGGISEVSGGFHVMVPALAERDAREVMAEAEKPVPPP
jgi:hypothetical protein